MRPKLEIRNVCLSYFSRESEVEAIRDLSLSVSPGEFVAIVGPSGCGKSSLLSIIAGLTPPIEGEIAIDGARIDGPSRKIGYMFQQDHLLEWRTVLDNVLLGAEIQGLDVAVSRNRGVDLLQRYGLGSNLDHLPRQLSGGMRQRAALARTLLTGPDIVLLDEPFSALDFQTRLALSDQVARALRQEEKTAILVTHDVGEAITMADRVVVLSQRPAAIKSEHNISFGGQRPDAVAARSTPAFATYFARIWSDLDVHLGPHAQ